eukprot:1139280-Pelagomonas_calceolata.AAC.2
MHSGLWKHGVFKKSDRLSGSVTLQTASNPHKNTGTFCTYKHHASAKSAKCAKNVLGGPSMLIPRNLMPPPPPRPHHRVVRKRGEGKRQECLVWVWHALKQVFTKASSSSNACRRCAKQCMQEGLKTMRSRRKAALAAVAIAMAEQWLSKGVGRIG